MVTADLEKPNGLCFSPDYSKLYISDTGISHKPGHPMVIMVYDVVDNSRLQNGRVFCDTAPSVADGFRCDGHGNIWTSAGWAGARPRRRPRLRPRRHAHRQDPHAGDHLQSLLWRPEAQPALHDWQPIHLCPLRRDPRSRAILSRLEPAGK